MAEGGNDDYMCYFCTVSSARADTILEHTIKTHHVNKQFSIGQKTFDDVTGRTLFKSTHYAVSIDELGQKCDNWLVPHIKEDEQKIVYKRKCLPTTITESIETAGSNEIGTQTENSDIFQVIPTLMEKVDIGRLKDLQSVFSAISSSLITDNIAFHLILDIGRFYTLSSIDLMRYPETTLQFWPTVKHVFKGKGLSFFRGYKGQGLNESTSSITPQQCRINFVVTADKILNKGCSEFSNDAKQPGILLTYLDSFAKNNTGKDVKLSIDGKNLATGLGTLGDEDLCEYEKQPSLQERKQKHEQEVTALEDVKALLEEREMHGSLVDDIPSPNLATTKQALLLTITNLSNRIKELRQLIVIRTCTLQNLLKQVDGDGWKNSKVAPAISFSKTKIVHAHAAIKELLESVDNIGYIVACINGTDKSFIRGHGQKVIFDNQGNYMFVCGIHQQSMTQSLVLRNRDQRDGFPYGKRADSLAALFSKHWEWNRLSVKGNIMTEYTEERLITFQRNYKSCLIIVQIRRSMH